MSIEEWKPVVGYEGYYEVSNLGRVKSVKTRQLRKFGNHAGGYHFIPLSKKGDIKNFTIHRLVLEAFVGKRPAKLACAHLDGNPKNNRLENLKWMSYKENESHKRLHGTHNNGEKNRDAKLIERQVRLIKKALGSGITMRKLAEQYGVSTSCIGKIKNRVKWKHLK